MERSPRRSGADAPRDASRGEGRRNRVALVTGGTGGIGTEVCKELAAVGNRVVATFPPAEREVAEAWRRERRSEGFDIALTECNVSSFDACARMAGELESRMGPVEILVNCAGVTRDKTLANMGRDQWDAVLDTNLDGVFNVTRNLVEGMLRQGYGRIVNISSVNGQKGQFGQTNYSASKAAVHGFTMAVALELAGRGITVNTISPGYVDTPLLRTIPPDVLDGIMRDIPLGRLARPREVARVVAFLAAEESGYITGANLPVNGGLYMS